MITNKQIQSLGAQLGILTGRPLTEADLDVYCSTTDLVLEFHEGAWLVWDEDRVVARA